MTAEAATAAAPTLAQDVTALKSELRKLLGSGEAGVERVQAAQRVEDIVGALEKAFVPQSLEADSATLQGRWRLLTTFVPGQAAAEFTSLESWWNYAFAKGPSPVQAAVFTNELAQRVYQAIDLSRQPGRWHNVVDANPFAVVCIQADLKLEKSKDSSLNVLRFQWTDGFIMLKRLPVLNQELETPVKLPYPVPFALLGDRARGTFDTVYLDEDLRVARGSKSGSVFVLVREPEALPAEREYYNPAS